MDDVCPYCPWLQYLWVENKDAGATTVSSVKPSSLLRMFPFQSTVSFQPGVPERFGIPGRRGTGTDKPIDSGR